MTPDTFRQLALSLPNVQAVLILGAEEFRIGLRTFASLGSPHVSMAMIKLTPQEQARFVGLAPAAFAPQPGGPGARGGTQVKLPLAEPNLVHEALAAASRKASRGTG